MYARGMQNSQSQTHKCPKCDALPGQPCVTIDGREAAKVHYGRPGPGPGAQRAFEVAERTLRTSPLRPNAQSTGIWIGSEFVGRGESVPYGAWYCPCGENREALSAFGVMEMNRLYGEHAGCRAA